MAYVDVVRFNPTAGGTGDFVVSSAAAGYQTPASASAADQATYYYRAESNDLSQWEIGVGTYTVSSTTLARTTVTANSLGTTAKISFSTAPQVGLVLLSGGLRERLTAARTYFVATTGSNSNSGLTVGAPFLTIQKAVDTVLQTLDLGGQDVVIQVAAGTYTAQVRFDYEWTGGGTIRVKGDTTTPGNVIISGTSFPFIITATIPSNLIIEGFRLLPAGFDCISSSGVGTVSIGNMEYGAASTGNHVTAGGAGVNLRFFAGYLISGNAKSHLSASNGAVITMRSGATITVTGTPAFSTAFATADSRGTITGDQGGVPTISGAATGTRYKATLLSLINTATGNVNYFPGNVAGTNDASSVYA